MPRQYKKNEAALLEKVIRKVKFIALLAFMPAFDLNGQGQYTAKDFSKHNVSLYFSRLFKDKEEKVIV